MPEWPKGAACKVVGSAYGGSNPPPATTASPGGVPARVLETGPRRRMPSLFARRGAAKLRRLDKANELRQHLRQGSVDDGCSLPVEGSGLRVDDYQTAPVLQRSIR